MASFITRIATVEIPVTDIEVSVKWYARLFNLVIQHKTEQDAMLSFNARGIPSLYLVRTDDPQRLSFMNSHTRVTHSVVDFFTYDLDGYYEYVKGLGIEVGPLNVNNGKGGFGFKDPDGNRLSATNIVQLGQE